jgi:hypothetical protein
VLVDFASRERFGTSRVILTSSDNNEGSSVLWFFGEGEGEGEGEEHCEGIWVGIALASQRFFADCRAISLL